MNNKVRTEAAPQTEGDMLEVLYLMLMEKITKDNHSPEDLERLFLVRQILIQRYMKLGGELSYLFKND